MTTVLDTIGEENKATYRTYIEQVFNNGNLEMLDELLSDTYVYHDAPPGTPPGREGIKQVVMMFRSAFPDLEISFEEQIAQGEIVCSRTVMRGTHTGSVIFGIQPTGNAVAMPGITMVRIVNGQLTDSWVKNETGVLMAQLGKK